MANAKFTSNRDNFQRRNNSFFEMVKARMTMDIEVIIKTGGKTPVDTGGMKAEVRSFKTSSGSYRVESGKEYSAPQELGKINGHTIRNYTTPGTGPGWFADAIQRVLDKRMNYIDQAKEAMGL